MYPDPLPKTSNPAQDCGKIIVLTLYKTDEQEASCLSINKLFDRKGFTQGGLAQWNFPAGADRMIKCVCMCCSLDG